MVRWILVCITGCLGTLVSLSAQDVTGVWHGYLDQSDAAAKIPGYDVYYTEGLWKKGEATHELILSFRRSGEKLTGIYHIITARDTSVYGRFTLTGTFRDGVLRYRTVEEIESVLNPLGFGFCANRATLTYSTEKGYAYLTGDWKGWDSEGYACADARIRVRKPLPAPPPASVAGRSIVERDTLTATREDVWLEIWDANQEDGDTVSLQLNGRWLVRNVPVTNQRTRIPIRLKRGENLLVFVAENLGNKPPNTAAISFPHGDGRKVLVLNSDMGKSESIRIRRE